MCDVPSGTRVMLCDAFYISECSVVNSLCRDIASAIKDLLDAVNEVFRNCQSVGRMTQYKEVNTRHKYSSPCTHNCLEVSSDTLVW